METKKCSKCGEVKPVGEFTEDKRAKNGLNYWCKNCHKLNRKKYNKQKYPCLECGKEIYKQNTLCAVCKQKKPKYTELKCDWCGKIKNEKCFSRGSKSNYGNGKKIYCIECTEKYYSEIRKKMWHDKNKKDSIKKYLDTKNNKKINFDDYLLKLQNSQLEYIKEIDYESYELALKLKEESAKKKQERQNQKRKKLRLTDCEYNERQKNISRERYNSKYIRITLEDGVRRCINVEKCSEEMKDAVQGLIDLRKKNNFIKETRNAKIKG